MVMVVLLMKTMVIVMTAMMAMVILVSGDGDGNGLHTQLVSSNVKMNRKTHCNEFCQARFNKRRSFSFHLHVLHVELLQLSS